MPAPISIGARLAIGARRPAIFLLLFDSLRRAPGTAPPAGSSALPPGSRAKPNPGFFVTWTPIPICRVGAMQVAAAIMPPERGARRSETCSARLLPWPGDCRRPSNLNPDLERALVGASHRDRQR